MPRIPSLSPALFLAAAANAAAPVGLFNGRDFSGWEFVANSAVNLADVCKMTPDGSITAAGKPVGFLATTTSYKNYTLHAEWRWPGPPGNGGVLVHIASGPKDRQWPVCFQIQLKHKSVGDLLPIAGATFAEPLTSPPQRRRALACA